MSLLSDDEIDAIANECFVQYMNDENDAYDIAFARAIESALLAKLVAKELPKPKELSSPMDERAVWGYDAAQFQQAHAQGFAAGAAAQLAELPKCWAIFTDGGDARMWSTFQPHVQKLANAEGLAVTELYTRREA